MKSTKGLTRIAAESDGESDDENDVEINNAILKRKCHWKFITMLVFIISCITAAALIIFVKMKGKLFVGEMSKDEAVLAMDGLMQLNVSFDNFTEDEESQYILAFNAFDKDNDGYLNRTEFVNYFQLELNRSSFFQSIDANNDNILSFSECVTYQHAMNEIDEVHQSMFVMIGDAIKREYGFEYNLNNNTKPDQEEKHLFVQYAALFLYFKPFDSDSKGYIRFDEYLIRASQNEFNAIDDDEDGKISLNELGNLLYGENNSSWKGILKQIFGDNYTQIMTQLAEIEITEETVQHINGELDLCPLVQVNNAGHSKRRRLYPKIYGPKYYKCCSWESECGWYSWKWRCQSFYRCSSSYWCADGYSCWCNSKTTVPI